MIRASHLRAGAGVAVLLAAAACEAGAPPKTPPISAGTSSAPRAVNIIARDWEFLPQRIDLVPGETVVFQIVNGGLEVHEAVFGDASVQDAWERAEAAAADHPPGPTPAVSVPAELAGLRVVVASGQRVDVLWTVPQRESAGSGDGLVVGCHIPGHWQRGMVVPISLAAANSVP